VSTAAREDGFWLRIIYIVSALVCAAVACLILGPRPGGTRGALDVSGLPLVNASLNGLTTLLLVVGWYLIKQKKVAQHRRVMLTAFASSSAFLVSYILYHWFKEAPRAYAGSHRGFYLTILLTHIVLAAAILPLALITLYRGWSMSVARHRRIARVTLPLWLYVSVTGVAIYAMLYL
jgi:putative membrane protein